MRTEMLLQSHKTLNVKYNSLSNKLKGRKNADISRKTLFWFMENLQQQKTLKSC